MDGARIPDLASVRIPRVDGLVVGRPIGMGGMGVVFAAREEASGDRVALKLISAAEIPEHSRARFAAEIDALAHVRDSHVVGLRRSGEVDGVPYAVLDYVAGFGVDEIRGAIPWQVAVFLGRQLARALAAVHAAGYVHRDVKPSNVMVSRRGALTLIDFGLAKPTPATEPRCPAGPQPLRAALTSPGVCMGTPRYLAPEVASGGAATPRADVYAFGLVLAHLLGPSVLGEPPAALLELVARCLERNPDRRISTAADLVGALDLLPARATQLRRNVTDGVALVAPPRARSLPSEHVTAPTRPYAIQTPRRWPRRAA